MFDFEEALVTMMDRPEFQENLIVDMDERQFTGMAMRPKKLRLDSRSRKRMHKKEDGSSVSFYESGYELFEHARSELQAGNLYSLPESV